MSTTGQGIFESSTSYFPPVTYSSSQYTSRFGYNHVSGVDYTENQNQNQLQHLHHTQQLSDDVHCNKQSIDDLIYQYASESTSIPDLDPFRYIPPAQYSQHISGGVYKHYNDNDTGTPTTGIYAQDGIWEEESDSHTYSPSLSIGTTTGVNTRPTTSGSSVTHNTFGTINKGGRSRSGTISSPSHAISGNIAMSTVNTPPPPAMTMTETNLISPSHSALNKMGNNSDDTEKEKDKEIQRGRIWAWRKPSLANMNAHHDHSSRDKDKENQISGEKQVFLESKMEKKRSKSRLRGKGRKGEASIDLNLVKINSPPPLPGTLVPLTPSPKTHLTANYPYDDPSSMSSAVPIPHPCDPNVLPNSVKQGKSSESAWKRGMNKIFRSKSSHTLRDDSGKHKDDVIPPPLPTFSKQTNKLNNSNSIQYPYSSSTLPLSEKEINLKTNSSINGNNAIKRPHRPLALSPSQRFSGWLHKDHTLSESIKPTTTTSTTPTINTPAVFPSHASLPLDPFASSLDLPSNCLPTSPSLSISSSTSRLGSPLSTTPPVRPKLPRHSPSLKDLKNLLPGSTSTNTNNTNKFGSLGKTKSLANLRLEEINKDQSSLPRIQSPILPTLPLSAHSFSTFGKRDSYRVSSVSPDYQVSSQYSNNQNRVINEYPATSPTDFGFPSLPSIESPPLLPPNPPYFPPSASLNRASRPPDLQPFTSQSIASSVSSPLTPPPTSPLPPTPLTSSSSTYKVSIGTVPLNLSGNTNRKPLSRSGSGPVLLPRSRSTSMSLKSPPTSSSFFDLYEQLGIWPTPEKTPEERNDCDKENTAGFTKSEPVSPLLNKQPSFSMLAQVKEEVNSRPNSQAEARSLRSTIGEMTVPISQSPSVAFSTSSWEAAINAFPIIGKDNLPSRSSSNTDVKASLDFGGPKVEDHIMVMSLRNSPEILSDSPGVDPGSVKSDNSSGIGHNVCSPTSSYHTARNGSASTGSASGMGQATSGGSQQSQNQVRGLGLSYNRPSRGDTANGSGASSRESSRSRRSRRSREGDWYEHGESSSSGSEKSEAEDADEEEDDVPLSRLHPEAQAHREEKAHVRARAEADKASKPVRRATVPVNLGAKVQGRNPGGGERWDGEGGVPPSILMRKLERLSLDIQRRSTMGQSRSSAQSYPWSVNAVASSSTTTDANSAHGSQSIRPQRSFPGPEVISEDQPLSTLKRASTGRRPPPSQRRDMLPPPPMPQSTSVTAAVQSSSLHPSPLIRPGSTVPSPYMEQHGVLSTSMRHNQTSGSHISTGVNSSPRHGSSHRVGHSETHSHGHSSQGHSQPLSRHGTTASSRQPAAQQTSLSRASTIKSVKSNHSSHGHKSRDSSDPTVTAQQQTSSHHISHSRHNDILQSTAPKERSTKVRAVLEGARRTIEFEVFSETNARDLISRAYASGDIGDVGSGLSWVIYEVFGELACEYEPILPILKGWDTSCRSNALVFRATNRSLPTFARAIPTTAPMLGGFVQYETKKGKWSKRWLETRGGQIFLAKNEKINASFFDIHMKLGSYKAPNTFVFVLKRAFVNPADYAYTFSAEEGVGYKLLCAIYDAKSFTLASTQPHLLSLLPRRSASTTSTTQSHRHSGAAMSRQRTVENPAPLVSIGETGDRSGFTGKGLLKV